MLQEGKKEGKLVVGIPARPELRKQLETIFKPKFAPLGSPIPYGCGIAGLELKG